MNLRRISPHQNVDGKRSGFKVKYDDTHSPHKGEPIKDALGTLVGPGSKLPLITLVKDDNNVWRKP